MLVVNRVDLWAYYLWGTLRLLLPDPFFFALGWFYGPAALRWMEKRTPTVGTMMRRLEGWFGRWGHPLVVLMPEQLRVPDRRRRRACRRCCSPSSTSPAPSGAWRCSRSSATCSPGRSTGSSSWSRTYRIPLLVVSIVVVAVMAGGELRRGRKEIEDLQELDHSLDPDAPPVPNHPYDPETDGRSRRLGRRGDDADDPGRRAPSTERTDDDGPVARSAGLRAP